MRSGRDLMPSAIKAQCGKPLVNFLFTVER